MTYREATNILRRVYDDGEVQAIVRLLGEKLFGMSFADIICGAFEQLGESDEKRLRIALDRSLLGEPIQYILGEETFCGRTFNVRPGVLIPRPETEELCQWIISENAENFGNFGNSENFECSEYSEIFHPAILDIGTGSGVIAITLALEIPGAEVEAIDISPEALGIARENAERLGAKVSFWEGDCLQGFDKSQHFSTNLENSRKFSKNFDIIVSNPPYVMEKEKAAMSRNVLDNEPALALFVPDDNPLLFYKAIADLAAASLSPGGKLFFEINPLCAGEMKTMLREKGFTDIEIRKDQFGKERMLRATH